MKIESYLLKETFKRRCTSGLGSFPIRHFDTGTEKVMELDNGQFFELSQSDFLNELYPSAHKIFSVDYRSNRAKFRYDVNKQENVLDGYEEVERVAIGIQDAVRRHKVTHTFGNDMWFGSEGDESNDALVSKFRKHWNITGMTEALKAFGAAIFGTGDSAIYLFTKDGKIKYKVFSYENGDVINMTKDEDGNDVFVRLFSYRGQLAVELYTSSTIELWVKNDKVAGKDDSSLQRFLKAVKGKLSSKESEDGYTLINTTHHNLKQCPVVYHRENDVCWGAGQSTIERIERILSDLAENNRYYAYQIMFLRGGVMSLPPVGRMGKVIASKSEAGDAKILQPADASNTFTIDLTKNLDLLWETLGMVVLKPEELRAGENSGAFIQNLYWRELQWSMNKIAELHPFFVELIDLFKLFVGIIEKDSIGYQNMEMSWVLEPKVPKNTQEEINNLAIAKGAGISSVRTCSGEISFNNPNEYERIMAEMEAEAKRQEALIKPEVKPEVKPEEPEIDPPDAGIDNKAKSK